ncbi:MAG: NAD(P)/FAD-dependent oxidoreductase [Myxococcales bacterium]|jgi:phytoene dehydrogenase-like protein
MSAELDAVIVGSGPNGLAAAALLAREGYSVRVIEGRAEIGGGTRTAELTLPGFRHDVCSAVHPMGVLSPFFSKLPLSEHGLQWIAADVSAAHPLDDGPAVLLQRSVEATAEQLEGDGRRYRALMEPFVRVGEPLMEDLVGPLRFPRHPLAMARFGFYGVRSALGLGRLYDGARAKALLAGCAAHAILPFERLLSGGVGLIFSFTAHLREWPVARGGSEAIAAALASYVRACGGEISTGTWVRSLSELPDSRVVLFDLAPKQVLAIAGDALPAGYRRRLSRYRYGPAVFKVDWALDGPIPWRDGRCAQASTVHVGGTLEEIAAAEQQVWQGQPSERPFVMVCQQSHFDGSRAPEGKHTGYAYCHVPFGCDVDVTEAIEAQVERFAPGFRDRILARATMAPADFEAYNPSFVGGTITGGVSDLGQFFTRPVARLDPYSTPNPRLFLCSSATPPGGGVHGMGGYYAALSAVRRLRRG